MTNSHRFSSIAHAVTVSLVFALASCTEKTKSTGTISGHPLPPSDPIPALSPSAPRIDSASSYPEQPAVDGKILSLRLGQVPTKFVLGEKYTPVELIAEGELKANASFRFLLNTCSDFVSLSASSLVFNMGAARVLYEMLLI